MRRHLYALLLLTTCGDGGPVELCLLGASECAGRCVRLDRDADNCGACGVTCPSTMICEAGACRAHCADGLASCGGVCVDLARDGAHCGACDQPCDGGEICAESVCQEGCAGDASPCGGACVDTTSDPAHCGGCDVACEPGQPCVASMCSDACAPQLGYCDGACVDLQASATSCGSCGHACLEARACREGICTLECGDAPCEHCELAFALRAGDPSSTFTTDVEMQDATAVAIDPATGDLVVAIDFRGTVSFAGSDYPPSGSGYDALVAKLDAHGAMKWVRRISGAGSQHVIDVAVSNDGDVLVGGYFNNQVTIDGTTADEGNNDEDGFVARLDTAMGTLEWLVPIASVTTMEDRRERVRSVAFAGDDVLLGGSIGGPAVIDAVGGASAPLAYHVDASFCQIGNPATDVHCLDAFLARLDSTGAYLWSLAAGGDLDDAVEDVASDTSEALLATGSFDKQISFGSDILTVGVGASGAAFLLKRESDGDEAWTFALDTGTSGFVNGISLGASSNDDVWLLGDFNGEMQLPVTADGPMQSNNTDVFVARMNAAGNAAKGWRLGDNASERADALALSEDDAVVVSGRFTGSTKLNSAELISSTAGAEDTFVATFLPEGDFLKYVCGRALSTQGVARPRGIAAFQGQVAAVGMYEGMLFTLPDAPADENGPVSDGFIAAFGLYPLE